MPRAPLPGFNHNIRHRGWLFHVQTEDSGAEKPHIATHVFHEGAIVASKNMVYDPSSDPDVVKSLMQAQHKAVMRELRAGTHDDKIDRLLVKESASAIVEQPEALLPAAVDRTAPSLVWIQKRKTQERPLAAMDAQDGSVLVRPIIVIG